jgi:uncharacterized protein YbjT (DUF2867 family)
MFILVTLANGKQGRCIIPALLQDPNITIRALVHSESSESKFKADFPAKNLETIVGDLMLPADLARAMRNVDTVFHICPPMSAHEAHIGILVIQAAQNAGVKHFIFSSVLHPVRSKLLNHDIKRQVEEYLLESKLNWTILQPTHFLQNTKPKEIAENGKLPLPYNPENEMGFVDLRDMAEVVVKILRNPEHHYRARYELCGENMSYIQYAGLITKVTGKKVTVERVDSLAIAKKVANGDVDYEDRFNRMLLYYDRWGLVGNRNILEWILGKPIRTAEQYIRDSMSGTENSIGSGIEH